MKKLSIFNLFLLTIVAILALSCSQDDLTIEESELSSTKLTTEVIEKIAPGRECHYLYDGNPFTYHAWIDGAEAAQYFIDQNLDCTTYNYLKSLSLAAGGTQCFENGYLRIEKYARDNGTPICRNIANPRDDMEDPPEGGGNQ